MVNVDRNELILFCEKNTLVLSNNIQQTVGIRMSVNCAPLLAEMFFYYCKVDFMQGVQKMKLVLSCNFTFCYDYFLSLNNSKFGDFVDRLYPIELEIKDTT